MSNKDERNLTEEQKLMEEAAGMNLDWGLARKFPNGIGCNSKQVDPRNDMEKLSDVLKAQAIAKYKNQRA